MWIHKSLEATADAVAYADLVTKYDVPGPRYTSYPTAPSWGQAPSEDRWFESLAQSLGDVGASVYVHVPFCESLCVYCGCTTRITRKKSVAPPYVDALLSEWQRYRDGIAAHRKELTVGALHLGGGTPTFLPVEELERMVVGLLGTHGGVVDASLEADPRVTSVAQLAMLARHGFRRLSLGVQDFDPIVQDLINRHQTVEQVRVVTDEARALGFTSVNYDLIYGLPGQTLTGLERTMRATAALRPDRIAFYGYAHVPWLKPGQRRFGVTDLPRGLARRRLYELGKALLMAEGYSEIGMDHFALPSDPLWRAQAEGTLHRSFMGYTERRFGPLIGLGVSAIGDSGGAFAQNDKVLEDYYAKLETGGLPLQRGHLLDARDIELRGHIERLMTTFETSWSEASPAQSFLRDLPTRLADMLDDGLVELTGNGCRVTSAGRPFVRNACMAFDAHLAEASTSRPGSQVFSRTV